MMNKHKSRWSRIILLCLCLSVIEKGWVTKIHPCKYLIRKKNKRTFIEIRNEQTNQGLRRMLIAFASGDMKQVEAIKDDNAHLQDLAVFCDVLKQEYQSAVARQEALLKDPDGILHFNLSLEQRDPLFTSLFACDREHLKNNPAALASFNDALLVRNRYKSAFHKAWNISLQAAPVVHQALYALIDCGSIPKRLEKIHELTNNPALGQGEKKELVEALFLPNGIIKDFAEYERAQTLQMPRAILQPEHSDACKLLNQLVYAERTSNDQEVESLCVQAIEYLQKSISSGNKAVARLYYLYAQSIYKQIDHLSSDRILNPGSQDVPQVHQERADDDQLTEVRPEVIRRSCGTGRQEIKIKNIGSCLPAFCVEDEKTHFKTADKHVTCGPQEYDPDKQLPRPCGYQGQTLPSMGADEIPASEHVSEGKKEETQNGDVQQENVPINEAPVMINNEENGSEHPQENSIEEPQECEVIIVNELADLSDVLVKVEGRGNTGRYEPANLLEQLVMKEIMSNPKGQPIPLVMKDSTWPDEEGWVKMQKNFKVYNRKTKKLEQIEIHYVWNESLELFDDFKFKNKPMELEDENSL